MTRAARVVPDVATFAVDDGFWYSVPTHLEPDIAIGSIVRVPLSGRRVRGWVVDMDQRDGTGLKPVAAISGAIPVFEAKLLRSLRWAAHHYVAPVSTLLARATPPNLPRAAPPGPDPRGGGETAHPLHSLAERSAADARSPITAYVGPWHRSPWLPAIGPVLASGRSVLVIAASRAEADDVVSEARRHFGDLAVAATGEDDAAETRAWETAQSAPRIVVGTPKAATWQVSGLSLAIVLEESRRAMKDRQTPTLHVRDVLRTRSRIEGFNLAFLGPTPGVELLASGAELVTVENRSWGLVEVVDRSEDRVGDGFLSGRTVAALNATRTAGNSAFLYTHRRVGSASTRCASCRSVRVCRTCGRRLARADSCPGCGTEPGSCAKCGGVEFEEMGTIPERLLAEVRRKLGPDAAAIWPERAPITIGTERDLTTLDRVFLAVATDVDGMLIGGGYRTSEEALRQLARLGTKLSSRSGSRLILQTSHADSFLVRTMRRGDPIPYLESVLVERARDGLPPSSAMLVIELRGDRSDEIHEQIQGLAGAADVLGPLVVDGARRWLLTGDLREARRSLRDRVGRWRDGGAVVRIDADPIDV